MIILVVFLLGMFLACYGAYKVEEYDDKMGIRPGGYGSNISYVWPYNHLAGLGFILALTSPLWGLL